MSRHASTTAALVACLAQVSCGLLMADSARPQYAPAQPAADGVTEITFERQCFGCEGPYSATLRQDGQASRTFHGNRRMGTADRELTGRVEPTNFERLAAVLVSEGFFDLADSYRLPDVADGQWVTVGAVRAGARKSVLDSNHAGPANLARIETAIEAVIEAVDWKAQGDDTR